MAEELSEAEKKVVAAKVAKELVDESGESLEEQMKNLPYLEAELELLESMQHSDHVAERASVLREIIIRLKTS